MQINRAESKKLAGYIAGTVVVAGVSSLVGGFLSASVASIVLQKLAESEVRDEVINFLKSISGNFFSDFSKSMGNKVSDRIQREKLQSANHHLQRSFQKAAKYALIDIGGADIFAQEWQTHQHEKNRAAHPVIKQAPFASTESYLKLLRQQPVLAKAILGQIGELFRSLIKLIDADKLLSINVTPPDTNQTPAVNDIRKLMNETQPEVFSAAFCEYFVAPAHDAYLNICNLTTLNRGTQEEANESFFAKHLRDHLLNCTLAHFGEILKTDTAPYRAYVRETLNDMRANLHDIKSDSLELQTGQAKIIAKIDGLIAQTETLGDGKTLDLLNNNIADLLGALGKAEKQDAQNFSDLFVFVTQHAAARDAKYDSTLTQILAALQRHLGEQRATSDVYNVEGLPSPYLGLAAYTFNDSAKFGGRDDEVKLVTDSLTDRDRERNLLFIVGASGCGKSSFAQAGLAPAVQRHYAALGKTLAYALMRPGNNPTGNLKNALDALDVANCEVNLLVLDQAEELFTQANEADRSLFLQWLAGLKPFAQSQQFVLVTLRREYENEFAARLGAMDIYDLAGMGREHLEAAIKQPISSAYPDRSKQIEPALVSKLALEAADRPTLLPLLQATLTELWKKGRLTLANYGRLIDAIDKLADTVYQFEEPSPKRRSHARPPETQRALLGVFTDLVKVSLDDDSAHDVRRSLPREAFGSERADLITELVNKRLLAVDNNQISIIHEALIQHWGQLHVALNTPDTRRYLQVRGRFELNLAQWQAHGQAPDRYLLKDEELDEARELEMRDDIVLRAFPAAREFLRVSRNAIEDKRQRAAAEAKKNAEVLAAANTKLQASQSRLRRAFAGVLVLTLVASGLGGWAYVERNNAVSAEERAIRERNNAVNAEERAIRERNNAVNAEERAIRERDNAANAEALAIKERNNAIEAQKIARSRELAALAQTQLEENIEASVLIAIEANQIAHTNESRTILEQGLEKSVKYKVLKGVKAAWSPDGKHVLTENFDNTVQIWDAGSGKALNTLRQADDVKSATWLPDSKQVLTLDINGDLRIFHASTGIILSHLRGYGQWMPAVLSPDGKLLLTASRYDTVLISEVNSGKPLTTLSGHTDRVQEAVWSPNGRQVLTASDDDTVRIWDANSGNTLTTFKMTRIPHTVVNIVWSPNGKQVLTANHDKTARIWDASSGQNVSTLSGHADIVVSAVWSPDGKQVLTASYDGTARIWDASSGEIIKTLNVFAYPLKGATWSPDGKQVLTDSHNDTEQRIWDAYSGKTLITLRSLKIHISPIESAAWSPDGTQVLTMEGDRTVRIWETKNKILSTLNRHEIPRFFEAVWSPDGRQILTPNVDVIPKILDPSTSKTLSILSGHTSWIINAVWSPDGKQVLTADDNTIRIWDASTGKTLNNLSNIGTIVFAAWSPDGRQVLTVMADDTMRIWEASTGKTLNILRNHNFINASSAAWSPDGKQLLTASHDGTARIWDVNTGETLNILSGHRDIVINVAWSPDGKQVLTASYDHAARIWDASSSKTLNILSGHKDIVVSAVWSPDGKQVLTASYDGTAQIWDASNGKNLNILNGHANKLQDAMWSPDGKQVLTASEDGTARIWNASNGKTLSILNGHTRGVVSAIWSPDGKQVLTTGGDGSVRLYYANIEDLIAVAKTYVSRELDCKERMKFLNSGEDCINQ